jgi:hypothetical protein
MMDSAPTSHPERTLLVALCVSQLRSLRDLQSLLSREILSTEVPIPTEIGVMLEDVANRCLDVSEAIIERNLAARQATPSSQEERALAYPA